MKLKDYLKMLVIPENTIVVIRLNEGRFGNSVYHSSNLASYWTFEDEMNMRNGVDDPESQYIYDHRKPYHEISDGDLKGFEPWGDYDVQQITPMIDPYLPVAVKTREPGEDCAIGEPLNLVWDKDKVSHVSRWDKSPEKVLLINVVINKLHK